MTELSHDARALIDESRSNEGASESDKARVKARLVARLGVGAFVGASTAGATLTTANASMGAAKLAKDFRKPC